LAPAESGRPETSAEFARRVRPGFVLRGPGERKEGGKTDNNEVVSPHDEVVSPHEAPEVEGLPELKARKAREAQSEALELRERSLTVPVTYPEQEKLLKDVKARYWEDPFYKKVLDSPKEFRNFEVTDGIVRVKLRDRSLLCVPDVKVDGRRLHEIIINDAHSLLAHLGTRKTLAYLREYVWWKTMVRDVQTFCDSCVTCQRSKPPNQKPFGLLNPLPIPAQPWEAVGIDFVGPLPLSKDRDSEYDSITVIIDLLTSMVHLVPSRTTYTAKDVAELMFSEVYKHHGLPKSIISNHDVLFTSLFWTHLNRLIGVKQRMSSVYHPETDGATERANRTPFSQISPTCRENQRRPLYL
jgi:hypothetical protein